ncbi:hypothetical protein AWG99_16670 [Escherichia coli]|nr:hypothetical protein AWG99_16670 [Escherichia coli]
MSAGVPGLSGHSQVLSDISALRRALTQELGSLRARQILAEHFPRGSATSLIEHRARTHDSENVIHDLAAELIRKQGYHL